MRFIVMHKVTDQMEKGLPPSPGLVARVGKFIGEAAKQKLFVSGEGLKPTSQRTHLAYRAGERVATDGPFTDSNITELVGGFALISVGSKDEALAVCDKLAAAMGGEAELILGPVVEPWDLRVGARRPEKAPQRFLSLHQDPRGEQDLPPDPAVAAQVGAVVDQLTKAGVLQGTGRLASSKKGARIHFEGKRHTVTDGPFAESKELVAGYAIIDLPTKAEAIAWAVRYGDVVEVTEVEVRELAES